MVPDSHFNVARRLAGASGAGCTVHHLIADDQIRTAAAARTRRRWLLQQRRDTLTLEQVALSAAQRNGPVALTTRNQASFRGSMRALAEEFCVVGLGHYRKVYIPNGEITSISTRGGDHLLAVELPPRPELLAVDFAEALSTLAARAERLEVRAGGQFVTGVVQTANPSLLGLQPDGAASETVWIRLSAIDYVVAFVTP